MAYTTIISVEELRLHLGEPDWVVVDARFDLSNPGQGSLDYEAAHIPGAIYAHLDNDLSGPIIKGVTGRHPLPGIEKTSLVFSRLGIDSNVQVVAYDDKSGALAAARVWWLLRWLGHEAAAVLDGGWQQWVKSGDDVRNGVESRTEHCFKSNPRDGMFVTAEQVEAIRLDPKYKLLDARSADRFKGQNETIDPVPGHIPGAISAQYGGNLDPDGTFCSPDSLRLRYKRLLGEVPAENAVVYCGSGVTAVHDILAMKLAGLGEARLYAGSYSEWITDPKRPVEK